MLKREAEYAELWEKNKTELEQNAQFLLEWLSILIEAESYRRKGYEQTIGLVRKILSQQ